MNNICVFNVRVSGDVKMKEITTGKMAWFMGGEKVSATKWQSYLFVGYGDVASRIERMSIQEGSIVNVTGSLSTSDAGNKIVVNSIDYTVSPKIDKPSPTTAQEKDERKPSNNLDMNDPFINCNIDDMVFY